MSICIYVKKRRKIKEEWEEDYVEEDGCDDFTRTRTDDNTN